jgi:SAM-dependent methyltransferase
MDFDPAADGRVVDVQASLTATPLRSGSVGFLLCSHVLEHIPDDLAAMREIARVLAPTSIALIQVPRKHGSPTDEDPMATIEERKARFGQVDHVRFYGDDFESRLRAANLRVETIRFSEVLPSHLLQLIGVPHDEELWLVTKQGDPLDYVDPKQVLDTLAVSLATAAFDLEESRETALAETKSWRSQYEWLKSRRVVRIASAGKRILKRVASSLRA